MKVIVLTMSRDGLISLVVVVHSMHVQQKVESYISINSTY